MKKHLALAAFVFFSRASKARRKKSRRKGGRR